MERRLCHKVGRYSINYRMLLLQFPKTQPIFVFVTLLITSSNLCMSDHSLEKSLKVRQQEAKLVALEQDIKKIQTTIKSLKTRLLNTQTRLMDIQRNVMNTMWSGQQKIKAAVDRVLTLLGKLKKDKRFSKADREQLSYLAQTIQNDLGEIDEHLDSEAQARAHTEDQERAEYRDIFQKFQVAPKAEDQADIRKLYLKLSKQFHPDKAANAQEAVNYHEIQQQVVAAYQSHDLQTLLELESWHGLATEELAVSAGDTDALAVKIKQLTQQLAALKKQQTRLGKEIKALRKSEMGELLTEVDSMERFGVSVTDLPPDMVFALKGIDNLIAALTEVDQTGKLDALNQLDEDFDEEDEFDLDIAMFQMFEMSDDDDDDEFYAGEDEIEELLINTKPRFTNGTWVEITISSEFFEHPSTRKKKNKPTTLKLTGRVLAALLTEQNEPVYVTLLNGYSLLQLPKKYLEESIEEHQLGVLKYVPESSLKKAPSPSDV